MAHVQQPSELLPDWQHRNGIVFANTRIAAIPGKGAGLVAINSSPQFSSSGHDSSSLLISVPAGLVLHAAAVEDYAKRDPNFRVLLDAVGHQSVRGNVLLYLMVQLVASSRQPGEEPAALPTPWTDYVRFLPADVPLPTTWTAKERQLLRGTSLEVSFLLLLYFP